MEAFIQLWSSIATLAIAVAIMIYAAAVVVNQKTWGVKFGKQILKLGLVWPLYPIIWVLKWAHNLIAGKKKKKQKKQSSDGDRGNTTIIHHHHYGEQQNRNNGDEQ